MSDRLADKKIRMELTEPALEHLARVSYDPVYGARYVRSEFFHCFARYVRAVFPCKWCQICDLNSRANGARYVIEVVCVSFHTRTRAHTHTHTQTHSLQACEARSAARTGNHFGQGPTSWRLCGGRHCGGRCRCVCMCVHLSVCVRYLCVFVGERECARE